LTPISNRRQFFRSTAGLTLGFGLASLLDQRTMAADNQPLYKISLAEWSFHRTLQAGKLNNLDFSGTAKQEFGIEGVEYVNQFFKDKAKDQGYLAELKRRAADHGVRSLLIMIDGEGALGDPDAGRRIKAVENHYPWVEAAKFLGCHSIRVNARSSGSYDEQQKLVINGLRRLAEFGAKHQINVIVENHGGLSSNGKWLSDIIRKINLPNCGTLPDFGNFNLGDGKTYDQYVGVAEMMPFAKAVSAKTHEFDDHGNETHTDFARMMKIVVDAGYHGYVGIEYEGTKHSEVDGVRLTKKLLERVRGQLS